MKRANKILMVTVAILLSLVLLSTSLVSGIFARFVVQKSGQTTVGLEKYGVKVNMTVDSNLKTLVGENGYKEESAGDSISATISNLTMYPGQSYPYAVKFEFVDGYKPTVDVQVNVSAHIVYTLDQFIVPGNVLSRICGKENMADDYFVPIGIWFRAPNANGKEADHNANSPYRNAAPNNHTSGASETVAKIVGQKSDMKYSASTKKASKTFAANSAIIFHPEAYNSTVGDNGNDGANIKTNISFNTFYLGFRWPDQYTISKSSTREGYTAAQVDEICTWLMSQTDRDFSYSVQFIVEIVQV